MSNSKVVANHGYQNVRNQNPQNNLHQNQQQFQQIQQPQSQIVMGMGVQVYQPQPIVIQPPIVNPVVAYSIQENEYTRNVVALVLVYYFFFIGCIGVEYGLYGSKQAADLWVSSYVFLGVALAMFFVIKQNPWLWLFGIQAFFLSLSLILEIAAFAKSVEHPVLYYYNYRSYNDRRLLSSYTYSQCLNYKEDYSTYTYEDRYAYYCDVILKDYSNCKDFYNKLSYSDYNRYFSYYCDYILGFNSTYDPNLDGKYGACLYIKENNSTYYYQYLETYCDPILEKGGGSSSYSYYDNNCIKNGSYDPYRDYCYDQQYAFMVYFVINFISYLLLCYTLGQRIYRFFIFIKDQKRVGFTQPGSIIQV